MQRLNARCGQNPLSEREQELKLLAVGLLATATGKIDHLVAVFADHLSISNRRGRTSSQRTATQGRNKVRYNKKTEKPLRVIFMGSPEFAVPSLQAVINRGHDIVCVYSQPPRPAGRGKKLRQTAVHDAAEKAGIPVLTPTSLKTEEAQREFASHKADLAVVAAYGLLLPQVILDTPRLGCLNVHASLLPRWRGAAPIHRAILAGDPMTGISIMQMTLGLDEGPVLAREEVAITPDMTSASLHDVLAATGGPLLVEAMEALDRGNSPLKRRMMQQAYTPKN